MSSSRTRLDRNLALAGLAIAISSCSLWFSGLFWTPESIGEVIHPLDYVTGSLWGISLVLAGSMWTRATRLSPDTPARRWITRGAILCAAFLVGFVLVSIDPVRMGGITAAFMDIQSAPPIIPLGLGICSVGVWRSARPPAEASPRDRKARRDPPTVIRSGTSPN